MTSCYKNTLNIDIETYSDIDLTKSGVYRYTDDDSFTILLIAYSINGGEIKQIDLTRKSAEDIRLLKEFTYALFSDDYIKIAFNANFERVCLSKYFGHDMPAINWKCTKVLADEKGFPPTLASVGIALGLPEDKQKDRAGKALITYFCKPCKPTKKNGFRTRNMSQHDPEKWEQFKAYNIQDVVTEMEIRRVLLNHFGDIDDSEQKLWQLDQKLNDRGIFVDKDLVNKILSYNAIYQQRLAERAKELTGLENPNSLTQLKNWYLTKYGLKIESLTKDTLPVIRANLRKLEGCEDGLEMLDLRAEMGKTSIAKYNAMEVAACSDNRLRGILQFYGANRTGRWAGRIVQVHNLPQNKLPDIETIRELAIQGDFETIDLIYEGLPFVFSQLIRTCFIPSEGCRFCVADFSAIEARVIACLAGEKWRMDVFATHGKIYEASASQMFHVPIESVKKGSKLRQQGKIAELALGYGGSVGAIKAMDKDGDIKEDEILPLVNRWRKASPNICKFWREVEDAVKAVLTQHKKQRLRCGIELYKKSGALVIKLLSGRELFYQGCKLDAEGNITYLGIIQAKRAWGWIETWGGKLVENIVQATARDCLAVTMQRVEKAGYAIVMHVHDEIICDVPWSDKDALKKITDIMSETSPWLPKLKLRGDGYETDFYRKD